MMRCASGSRRGPLRTSINTPMQDSVHLVKEPPHVVLRIFVPYGDKKNTTVTMRFLPSTRTHQVIEKLCQRFQTMQIGNLDAFMLYVEERAGDMYTCMQENEPISSYNISVRFTRVRSPFPSRSPPRTASCSARWAPPPPLA